MNCLFEVTKTGGNGRYDSIKLPNSWKIQQTINIAVLERYWGTYAKKQVVKIVADDTRRKMEPNIPSSASDDYPRRLVYLVKWEGFKHDENTWEMYETVLECLLDLLKNYYSNNLKVEKTSDLEKIKD